jgi:pseudaminic acid cytidylyltransferase
MKLAVIPARGGSKRIPRKNIKPFCGKPMIAWSIEAALASGCFDQVVVSTDDAEIAAVAREWGASVPFVRPAALSDDHAGTTAVIAHAVDALAEQGMRASQVCCIYATAPFIAADDLRQGLATLASGAWDYVFAATSYAFPIQRAIRIDERGAVAMFDPAQFAVRSQDLAEALHDAGQFYWGNADAWCAGKVIFGPGSAVVRLPRSRVQDIDNPEDWEMAEAMFEVLRRAKPGENRIAGDVYDLK